ncbi:immunoglobulin-binding protein 1 [Anthonomus grandis grandis]|uniref:immunoglobulin-binding protein 1 n=1 Tax=Anthonomus grandis grandis TaxID=2921223 RepID=UPI00216609A8|nr:immunoglobulin-binding protein 1 [Anthonomus grandis grandis]
MCSKPDEDVTQTLHTIFHEGLDLYNKVSNSNEPTNSPQIQRDVQKGIALLEQATRLVSLADIFSKNEELDELATNDIQYLLLPALLGFLTAKLTSRERKEVVEIAEVYFKDFLQRTNGYKLSNYHFNKPEETVDNSKKTDFELLSMAVNTRANKIQKYREHKELKEHLNNLKTNVENEHADEDIKRKYFLTMLRVFIHDVVDELESINMEKPILEHMAAVKREDAPKPKRPPPPPLKPIIITKDAAQKAVYGAGYPSLPTMTVDEFYEKRVAEGAFPDPNKPREAKGGAMSLQEASLAGISLNDQQDQEEEETENKEERDDEELIARMRARDEYRDEHRRGWGNRMNRS